MNMDPKNFCVNARAFPVSDALHLPSGAVKSEQGFSYFGRVRVKKLVHNVKLMLEL